MNARSPVPQDQKPPARRQAADLEFQPAALEILETPPSPVRLAFILVICGFFAAALAWSVIGRIDIVAMAPGRIQPTGRVKPVQALESGRITEVTVRNGSHVEEGAVLITLDRREAEADAAQIRTELAAAEAEAIRRRAAITAASRDVPEAAPIAWPPATPAPIRLREQRVLDSETAALAATLASIDAQSIEKEAERARLETTVAAQEALIATQGERVGMRSRLMESSAGSRAQLIDAQEAQQLQQVTLAEQRGQLVEARAALQRLERERSRITGAFLADNEQKLADIEGRIDEARDKLAKAEARLEQMTIRAPIAGTVAALAPSGSGQVVTTGQEVMRIVPDGSKLELEAYVSNRDIGFIHEGQHVAVKIDAFPFTRYGILDGRIAAIAHDAVARSEVSQQMVSPGSSPRSTGLGGTQAVEDLVFPVIVALDRPSIEVDGVTVPLSPGMSAVAEIKTGTRRIIDYLLSPLAETGSEALRER